METPQGDSVPWRRAVVETRTETGVELDGRILLHYLSRIGVHGSGLTLIGWIPADHVRFEHRRRKAIDRR